MWAFFTWVQINISLLCKKGKSHHCTLNTVSIMDIDSSYFIQHADIFFPRLFIAGLLYDKVMLNVLAVGRSRNALGPPNSVHPVPLRLSSPVYGFLWGKKTRSRTKQHETMQLGNLCLNVEIDVQECAQTHRPGPRAVHRRVVSSQYTVVLLIGNGSVRKWIIP